MKENIRKIFIGLVVGILICALLYALSGWYLKTGKAIYQNQWEDLPQEWNIFP